MAAWRPFWKWYRWKSIGFCLWPPSTCIWYLKLKFQRKLDLCSGNHVVYRQTDRRTDGQGESSIPLSNFVGRGYNNIVKSAYMINCPYIRYQILALKSPNIKRRHTAHTIVSWPNPEQWLMIHTSNLIMIIRLSTHSRDHRGIIE